MSYYKQKLHSKWLNYHYRKATIFSSEKLQMKSRFVLISLTILCGTIFFQKNTVIHFLPRFHDMIQSFICNSDEPLNRPAERCNVYDGKWVRDNSNPYYPVGLCPYAESEFDCHFNGRRDFDYLNWRWQPFNCDVPIFNATDFLERLRGKKMVFVGDSLNRNMWESLVCILWNGVERKDDVYEITGKNSNTNNLTRRSIAFKEYNFSLAYIKSPFLVKQCRKGENETLRVDRMDEKTSMYHDANILVFNTGNWWAKAKTFGGEYFFQEGKFIHPKLDIIKAYKKGLMTWAKWVDKNIQRNRTTVLFSGISAGHYSGGLWNSGGQCHDETKSLNISSTPFKKIIFEEILRKMKTPVVYMNITRMTQFRKDGHPSIYRKNYNKSKVEDCIHWCLPGIPDTWNRLLYATLLNLSSESI